METIFAPIVWLLGLVFSILWWIVTQIVWIVVWLLLPVAIVLFVALRLAEYLFGREVVRAWVKARSMKYGANVWARARRLTFALGTLPFRVLLWFVVYAVWHSLVSLLWRPKWSPWARAWAKRWRPPQQASPTGKSPTRTRKA